MYTHLTPKTSIFITFRPFSLSLMPTCHHKTPIFENPQKVMENPTYFTWYRHRVLILTSVGFQSSKIIQSRDFALSKVKFWKFCLNFRHKTQISRAQTKPGLNVSRNFRLVCPFQGRMQKMGKIVWFKKNIASFCRWADTIFTKVLASLFEGLAQGPSRRSQILWKNNSLPPRCYRAWARDASNLARIVESLATARLRTMGRCTGKWALT